MCLALAYENAPPEEAGIRLGRLTRRLDRLEDRVDAFHCNGHTHDSTSTRLHEIPCNTSGVLRQQDDNGPASEVGDASGRPELVGAHRTLEPHSGGLQWPCDAV